MHRTLPAACLTHVLLAVCCFLTLNPPAVSAQTYGLRSSDWTGNHTDDSWFDCRNWDNAAPDAYTAARVDGNATITDNGSHKAKAATLTIDTSTGRLTIAAGGELEITAQTNTPATTRRYDEWTWLTTHNAHTALEYNALYAQQSNSITEQLEDGARGLMLDVYDWGGIDDDDLYLCHNDCTIPFINPNTLGEGSAIAAVAAIGVALALGGPGAIPAAAAILGAYVLTDNAARMKFADGLEEIEDFLASNSSAIVTLIIEDYAEHADINQRLIDAGLTGYMYDPAVDHPEGKTGCWPSTQWMVANGKRLVVFIQDGTADLPGKTLGQFAYTVENTYNIGVGADNYDPTCERRSGSSSLNSRSRKLFVMNHFPEITIPTSFSATSSFDPELGEGDYDSDSSPNDYQRVIARVDGECYTASSRYPNFIAFDFFDRPGEDGPARVVNTLNARWTPNASGYNAAPWFPTAPVGPASGSDAVTFAQAEAGAGTDEAPNSFQDQAIADVQSAVAPLPVAYGLEPNFPNPFATRTTIRYALPEEAYVRLTVYDLVGRVVDVLADGAAAAGRYDAAFDASGLPAGVYLYRLEAGRYVEHRKMLVVK